MKVSFTHTGGFDKTEQFLKKIQKLDIQGILVSQAKKGVAALSSATPKDSARAASSWNYEIIRTPNRIDIVWTNSDIENGFPVAIMIQYGHGTGTGGYVQGIDYINPAMRPIFDQIAQVVWRAVISS
jgi:hypothetical protein